MIGPLLCGRCNVYPDLEVFELSYVLILNDFAFSISCNLLEAC